MLTGTPFPRQASLEMGLVDELVEEGKLREGAIAFARKVIAAHMPLHECAISTTRSKPRAAQPEIFENFRKANARKFRGFEAWKSTSARCKAAVDQPFDEGLKIERQAFLELVTPQQSPAQRYVFFAERQANKIPDVPDDTPAFPINKVGIIGAGTMGGGIAMNFLNAGIPVTIVEAEQEALDRGLGTIRRNYENTAKHGRLTQDEVETRMGRSVPG